MVCCPPRLATGAGFLLSYLGWARIMLILLPEERPEGVAVFALDLE